MALCPQCQTDNIAGTDTCANCGSDLRYVDAPRPGSLVERSIMEEPIGPHLRSKPVTVRPDTPLRDVVSILADSGLSCVIVVDGGDKIAGIFSERDLLLAAGGEYASVLDHPVSQYMTADPVTVTPDSTLTLVLQKMLVGDYRHLPVAHEGDGPAGVVSGRDMLNHLIQRVNTPPPA